MDVSPCRIPQRSVSAGRYFPENLFSLPAIWVDRQTAHHHSSAWTPNGLYNYHAHVCERRGCCDEEDPDCICLFHHSSPRKACYWPASSLVPITLALKAMTSKGLTRQSIKPRNGLKGQLVLACQIRWVFHRTMPTRHFPPRTPLALPEAPDWRGSEQRTAPPRSAAQHSQPEQPPLRHWAGQRRHAVT